MASAAQTFPYKGWYRWSVVVGPLIAISPPFWPLIGAGLLNGVDAWNNVAKMPMWAWVLLISGAAVFLWAYADLQFWRRDIRVTSKDVTSMLFGWEIYCIKWTEVKSIIITSDFNQDHLKPEERCKLISGSREIGFKDYISGYPDLIAIIEAHARVLSIPVTREDRSGRSTCTVSKP